MHIPTIKLPLLTQSFIAQVNISSSSLQKRILGIALLALTALAVGYCLYLTFLKNRKIEEKIVEEDPLPVKLIPVVPVPPKPIPEVILEEPKHDKGVKGSDVDSKKEGETLKPLKPDDEINEEAKHHKEVKEKIVEQDPIKVEPIPEVPAPPKPIPVITLEQRIRNLIVSGHYDNASVEWIVDIRKEAKSNKQESAIEECESYFKNALSLSPDQFTAIFQIVKDEPEIMAIFLDAAIDKWEKWTTSYTEKDRLSHLFITSFNSIKGDEENSLRFILMLLIRMKRVEIRLGQDMIPVQKQSTLDLRKTLESLLCSINEQLSDDYLDDLTQLILNEEKQPWDLLRILMGRGFKLTQVEKIDRILTIALPSLNDPKEIQELWNFRLLAARAAKLFSKEQIELLMTQWFVHLPEQEAWENVMALVEYRSSPEELQDIVEAVQGGEWGEWPDALLKKTFGSKLQPALCSCCVLFVLNSNLEEGEKIEKMKQIISIHLNGLEDKEEKDEYRRFAHVLGERCSLPHIPMILKSFLALPDRQRLGESFLLSLLKNPNPDQEKIKAAFGTYWPSWKSFEHYLPACSMRILPGIQSEETLRTVYEAYHDDDQEGKKTVRDLLLTPHTYYGFRKDEVFRVALPQEVIDRVLA